MTQDAIITLPEYAHIETDLRQKHLEAWDDHGGNALGKPPGEVLPFAAWAARVNRVAMQSGILTLDGYDDPGELNSTEAREIAAAVFAAVVEAVFIDPKA